MSALQLAALVAALIGLAAMCVGLATRRAPRSLAAARRQMFGVPIGEEPAGRFDVVVHRATSSRAGGLLVRGREEDLDLLGMTRHDLVSRVIVAVLVLAVIPAFGVTGLTSMGLLPASPLWFVACLGLGVGAGWIAVRDVASKATARRQAIRAATNDFVQLVAVGLTTDQSVEEAIRFAVGVGAGDGFEELRTAILTAPQRGIAVWDALAAVGARYGVRELGELASSVERQGLHGVAIGETVTSMAAAMRARALDDLEREADRANANLSGPTIGFVVATVVFLAFPLAQRISDAFGG